MTDDEIQGNGGRFFKEPDDDAPEGHGCAGAVIGLFLVLVIIGIVVASVWLFWPGGDKP